MPGRARVRVEPTQPAARKRPRDVRKRLLECTTVLLRERGLAFVSLRAVARRARVSHGAPAYHFRNKAGLLAAYAADSFRRLIVAVERALADAGDDPREQLESIGRAYVHFAVANPERFDVMFRRELHAAAPPELAAESARAIGLLVATVRRGAERRHDSAADADVLVASAWSIAHGLAVLWLAGRLPARIPGADADALTRAALHRFVHAMLG